MSKRGSAIAFPRLVVWDPVQESTESDRQLVQRAVRGDVDAYGELVRRYQDHAVSAAYVILGDRHESEDAAQEAFTNGFVALKRFRPDGSFRAWILRAVVNEARDLRAARQRRAGALVRAPGQVEPTGPAESAEVAALAQRRREALLESLFRLSEVDRLVITCRYFLDLSEAEIAGIMGVARGTVKSRLARALARLGPILRDIGPLVLVGPTLERTLEELGRSSLVPGAGQVHAAVLQQLATGSWSAGGAEAFRTRVQHFATTAGAVAVAVLIGGLTVVSGGRTPPPAPVSAAATAQSALVYGGDLTEDDRQQLAQTDGFSGGPMVTTQTVSRQELIDTLSAQGMSVRPTDEAISSAALTCQPPGSGIRVRTRNITRIPAPEYAAVLITAGLYDAAVTIAAPQAKPVTGETALVGVFKAFPSCTGAQLGPDRMRLAYEQLKVTADLAENASDMMHASAAFLQALQSVLDGQATDATSIANAVDTAAGQQGVTVTPSIRAEVVALIQQLRDLDYGPYARGYSITNVGENSVQVLPVP